MTSRGRAQGLQRRAALGAFAGSPRTSYVFAIALLATGSLATASPAVGATDQAPASGASSLEPFYAHYTADWRGINVGTSDLELKSDTGPDNFVYTWTMTARGVFRLVYANDVIQKSWLSILAAHAKPERYRAEDGSSTASIDFDWPDGHARGESEKKPVDVPLSAGTQDILSIQIEVMLDLRNGTLPATFRILDKDEIKDFVYTHEGTARIRTALGVLDTEVVASRRTGGNRVLRMWFAPSLRYVPVLAERSRDGKVEFAMKIKALRLDRDQVLGSVTPR